MQGGVGLRIRVYDRRICFVGNHFAAHQENVSRRNADFDHIYRTMSFNKPHGSTGILVSNSQLKVHIYYITRHATYNIFSLLFYYSFYNICPVA